MFFSTSLQDNWWNSNGWCWTNTKDDSILHVWNFLCLECQQVGSWCLSMYLIFGDNIDSVEQPIKSNSAGSGNMSHSTTSSLDAHIDHCFVVIKDVQQKLPYEKKSRLRKQHQHYSDHQSFHDFSFALEIYTGLSYWKWAEQQSTVQQSSKLPKIMKQMWDVRRTCQGNLRFHKDKDESREPRKESPLMSQAIASDLYLYVTLGKSPNVMLPRLRLINQSP